LEARAAYRVAGKKKNMSLPSQFLLFTGITTFSALILIFQLRSEQAATRLANAVFYLSLILSQLGLLEVILSEFHLAPSGMMSSTILRILIYRLWLVVGFAISSSAVALVDAMGALRALPYINPARSFTYSTQLLRALSVSVALSFLSVEVGKLVHDNEMRQFFLQSGLAIPFMYLVMGAEVIGAFGLLFARTRGVAAGGLAILMVGAIATHARNRDPFADSLEAVHLLIILSSIVLMQFAGPARNKREKIGAELDGMGGVAGLQSRHIN
jgi:uncharacterized membrane protein YphA (DoxX/SURF4 family)